MILAAVAFIADGGLIVAAAVGLRGKRAPWVIAALWTMILGTS